MEIVKRGIPPKERVYEATCRECRSILRFKQSEGEITYDREGTFITITCPVCNTLVHKDLKK